jgi:hypothetical protein
MDDLVTWLGKQLDEDERVAMLADTGGSWALMMSNYFLGASGSACMAQPMAEAFGPARVLAEVEAKRAILRLHETVVLHGPGGYFDTRRVCKSCEPPKQFPETATPCPTLLALALPYRERPGYRPE